MRHIRENRNAYGILVGTLEERILLGIHRHSLEDFKLILNKQNGREWNGFIWLHYRGKKQAVMNTVTNRGIQYKEQNIFSGLGIIRFHRRTLLCELISYLAR
jgi:hypothetical protein